MKHKHLKKKGWSDDELIHLEKHFSPKQEGKFLIFILLLLLGFAVIGVPYAYALLSQIIPSALLYTVLLLVGAGLGAVFGVLLTDIDRLQHHHHLVLVTITPILSITSLIVSMNLVTTGLFAHNVYIASLIYAFGFVVPYAILITHRWNLKKQ
jgi:hypothetical protein